jgi:hypothetical protein
MPDNNNLHPMRYNFRFWNILDIRHEPSESKNVSFTHIFERVPMNVGYPLREALELPPFRGTSTTNQESVAWSKAAASPKSALPSPAVPQFMLRPRRRLPIHLQHFPQLRRRHMLPQRILDLPQRPALLLEGLLERRVHLKLPRCLTGLRLLLDFFSLPLCFAFLGFIVVGRFLTLAAPLFGFFRLLFSVFVIVFPLLLPFPALLFGLLGCLCFIAVLAFRLALLALALLRLFLCKLD